MPKFLKKAKAGIDLKTKFPACAAALRHLPLSQAALPFHFKPIGEGGAWRKFLSGAVWWADRRMGGILRVSKA
ncbi:hypothetical protein C1J02_08900 [Sulfitobacter sp. SK011]|nr:hypothetical protein C1J02_08900 [Sulfitobacter sp. SK011]